MKTSAHELRKVHQQIQPALHQTPVLTSGALNSLAGAQLYFKCENFQKTGSFKARGAYYSVLSLTADEKQRGVATHSSGNHGQALAWAAKEAGVKAHIIMPKDAPKVKVAAVKAYGGQVHFCTANLASRESELKCVQAETGAVFIPPYNFENTILGQATCGLELLNEISDLQTIIAPVGGGGLLSGTCLAAKHLSAGVAVYGAEPSQADDAYRSIHSGELVTEHEPHTIADGLRTTLGNLTFPIIKARVADILLADEDEILAAMRLIYERLKIVIEPSCALPLAVVLKNPQLFAGKKIGLILTGGNVDLAAFFKHLAQQEV
jgi:threonine dehydratase